MGTKWADVITISVQHCVLLFIFMDMQTFVSFFFSNHFHVQKTDYIFIEDLIWQWKRFTCCVMQGVKGAHA